MVRRRSGEKGAWKTKGNTGGREIAKQHPPCCQSVEAWRRKKKRKEKGRAEGEEEGMARRAESWRNNRQTVTPEVPIVLLVDWAEARVYVGACSGLARRLYR